jgi:hypothetical protein
MLKLQVHVGLSRPQCSGLIRSLIYIFAISVTVYGMSEVIQDWSEQIGIVK